jgi:AcrR family transcriptional regulator
MPLTIQRYAALKNNPDLKDTPVARQILNGAIVAMLEVGLNRASTRLIAEHANLSAALINYHFGSKDELIAQALLEFVKRYNAHLLEFFESASSVEEALSMSCNWLCDSEKGECFAKLRFELIAQVPHIPAVAHAIQLEQQRWLNDLENVLIKFQNVSWANPVVTPLFVSTILDGFGVAALMDVQAARSSIKQILEQLTFTK